ncbi:hypothetical protein CEXT_713871 [Caerostris extrusa]|uniref:Uncharacterized protein n=1 Tax=Caerostris extrusa TaxID=172846 RepID=A0AAV4S6C3_CAEEX|nr:hypothetical protein CEXT_713871 [Caerostris extrusa]
MTAHYPKIDVCSLFKRGQYTHALGIGSSTGCILKTLEDLSGLAHSGVITFNFNDRALHWHGKLDVLINKMLIPEIHKNSYEVICDRYCSVIRYACSKINLLAFGDLEHGWQGSNPNQL